MPSRCRVCRQSMWREGACFALLLLWFCFAFALLLLCFCFVCFCCALHCLRIALLCYALLCIALWEVFCFALLALHCFATLCFALLFVFICNNQRNILNKYVIKGWTVFPLACSDSKSKCQVIASSLFFALPSLESLESLDPNLEITSWCKSLPSLLVWC